MSSVLNIGGNFFQYNYSPTPDRADARALLSDWLMVGQDIATAMKQRDPQQSELPLGV
ncbi:MAG: hypothetical protein ABSD58_15615 [Verrucomicrobiia bacterium]